MDLVQIAEQTIPKPANTTEFKKYGETQDIIAEVLSAYKDCRNQLKKFSKYLKAESTLQTCSNIWNFFKTNIRYQVDPAGQQWIKSPARVWQTKFCDCKSFSVAVASCLHSLGIPGKFRFTSYGENNSFPTHVYIVAMDGEKEIIIDCVWNEFNGEKPFRKKWDYNMTAIYRLAGFDVEPMQYRIGELNIDPSDVGTTEAEFELALRKQTLEMEQLINRRNNGNAVIGGPVDNAYQVEIESHAAALSAIAGKRGKARKLRKAMKKNDGKGVTKKQARLLAKAGIAVKKRRDSLLKRVGKGITKVLKTPVRLLAKTQLPKNAPFFLYLFLDSTVLSKAPEIVRVKRAKAENYKRILVNKLQMKESNFNSTIRNGIMNHYGQAPEAVLAEWMKNGNFKLSGVGLLPVLMKGAKFAADGLKALFGKMGEKLKEDVEQFSPVPEDWGGTSQEALNEMANSTQSNQSPMVNTYSGGGGGGSYTTDTGDKVDYNNGLFNEKGFGNDANATGEDNLNTAAEDYKEPSQAGGGTGMLLIALAAVGLLASGSKGSRKK